MSTKVASIGVGNLKNAAKYVDKFICELYTTSSAISAIVRSGSVVTVTTTTLSAAVVGQTAGISGVTDTTFDGSFVVTSINTGLKQFTYNQTGTNTSSSGGLAITGLVAKRSSAAIFNSTLGASGQWVQKDPIIFDGLTLGTAYNVFGYATAPISGAQSDPQVLSITAGSTTAPSATFAILGSSRTAAGVVFSWTVSGASSDVDRYEGFFNFTGTTPSSSDVPLLVYQPSYPAGQAFYTATIHSSTGQTIYLFLRAVNTSQIPSAWTGVTGSNVAVGTLDNVGQGTTSTVLNPQGSIPPNQTIAFTLTTNSNSSGSCTQTWTWSTTTMTRGDGSTFSVTGSTATWTGLSANTTYYYYPYIRTSDNTIHWSHGDPNTAASTSANLADAITQNLDGHIPATVGNINATTPASSGGSGSGGGGSNACIEENETVCILLGGHECIVPIGEVEAGAFIKGYDFNTDQTVFRKVLRTVREWTSHWKNVADRLVTPCEQVWNNGEWQCAYEIDKGDMTILDSYKIKVTVEADSFDNHNFYLTDGDTSVLVHNVLS